MSQTQTFPSPFRVMVARTSVRRVADEVRNRILWMLLGIAFGVLSSVAVSAFALNGRLATVEAEIRGLRKDVDRLSTAKP